MKTLFSKQGHWSVLIIGLLLLFAQPGYASLQHAQAIRPESAGQISAPLTKPGAKIGFFKKIRLIKAVKKSMTRQMTGRYEQASPMARLALGLFIGSFAIGWIPAYIFAIVSGLAFLTSIILACLILFIEDNWRSRAIAKTILIIGGILIVISVVLIVAFINAWG